VSNVLLTNAAVIAGCMFVLWLLSLLKRDVSIVDLFWGPGFAVVALVTRSLSSSQSAAADLLCWLTCVWAARLGLYLAWRNHGRPEDYRYQQMRERRGQSFWLSSLFIVFGLQGVVMWTVSLPLQLGISATDHPNGWLVIPGLLIWLVGIYFESVGDWQLARFRANPENKGQLLCTGVWRLTRHPNYFGDFAVWWGLFLIAASSPQAWWTIISPLLMSTFLRCISGVTLLEKSLVGSKPGYAEYAARTNAFFPWLPRRSDRRG
jgi:steroid 5-alpha reductase family enzyme